MPTSDGPQGPARRALRFAAMGAGVTGSYLGYLVQQAFLSEDHKRTKLSATHTKAAQRVTREMLALRGPAMKLGQSLSLHTALLPEETLAELSQLQMRAPGMHPSLVRAQFKAGMGAEPEEVYRRFDPTPFAAASLGQVHHAVTHEGERVVVKIQYPGIRDAIENDFKWFRVAFKPAQLLRYLPENILTELQEQILAECDYRREADNAALFQRHMTRLPFVELPRVHAAYSSDTVLTMSMVRGTHLDDFLAKRPSQKLRNLIGERLIESYFFQILEVQALHADPHWGNYLFGDDGTIGLIDFGCVKYFQPAFVANLRAVFLYPGSHDSAGFRRLLAERYVGRGRRLTPAAHRALVSIAENFFGKVYPSDPALDGRAFDFGDSTFLENFSRESAQLGRAKATLPEYVFLARSEIGLYQTLHKLRARARTSVFVRKYAAAGR